MSDFKGYVLQAELAAKANVSLSLFRQLDGVEFKKMGNYTCILKDSLPDKYKKIAEKCQDLEEYWSYSYISREIGMCEDYFSQIERYRILKSKKDSEIELLNFKKIGGAKLLQVSIEFIEKIRAGLNPFKIKDESDKELAKEIVVMQGIEIGFY